MSTIQESDLILMPITLGFTIAQSQDNVHQTDDGISAEAELLSNIGFFDYDVKHMNHSIDASMAVCASHLSPESHAALGKDVYHALMEYGKDVYGTIRDRNYLDKNSLEIDAHKNLFAMHYGYYSRGLDAERILRQFTNVKSDTLNSLIGAMLQEVMDSPIKEAGSATAIASVPSIVAIGSAIITRQDGFLGETNISDAQSRKAINCMRLAECVTNGSMDFMLERFNDISDNFYTLDSIYAEMREMCARAMYAGFAIGSAPDYYPTENVIPSTDYYVDQIHRLFQRVTGR